jgi:ATP-dependent exoDNAse (exonuclease V) alpha subunit
MVSAELLDMISYRVRSMGYTGRMMFVGDFFQLPPVQKDSGTSLFGDEIFAFESSAWELFAPKMLALTKMQRTKNRAFTKILQKIRLGYCDEKVKSYLLNLATHQPTADATYLYGTNYQADQKNRVELSQIEEQEHRLLAQEEKIKSSLSEKRVESWKRLLPISHELHIKVGAPILFTVNKYGKFYNGERGVIKAIEEEFLIVEKEEELIKVERHDFELTEVEIKPDGKLEDVTLFRVGQYPIKLAYAITIHKSQGMSIESLVCNIDKIFTPSQFYVAISRAMDPERLAIEYTQGAIEHYIDRIIQIDQKVLDFYRRVAFEAEGDTASGG